MRIPPFFILLSILFCFSGYLAANPDSTLRAYLQLALEQKENYQYDSGLIILEKALTLLEFTDNLQHKADVYAELARMNLYNEQFKQAFYYYNQAIIVGKKLDNYNIESDYIGLSMTFLERGISDTALLYIDTARYYKEQKNDSVISTSLENNTARIYMEKGNFDIALKYFYRALQNAQKEKDTTNLIYVYLNMGTLYQRMEKYDEALDSYLKSLEISKAANNLEGMAYAYSIGIIYVNRGDYTKALKYYTEAISPCKKLNKLDDLSNIYSNMSNVYMLTNKFDEAAKVLRKSIALSSNAGYQRQLGVAYANMGKTMELSGQDDSSIYYLKKSLFIFQELGTRNLVSTVYKMISDAFETNKDFENALIYKKKQIELADSIFSEKVEKQIAELRTKYKTEKKEQENTLLKKGIELEKKKTSYLTILAIILIFAGVVSIALFYFIRKNALSKKKLAELEAEKLEEKIAHQKRELASSTLTLSRNLEFINSLIEDIQALSDHVDSDKAYSSISRIVKKLEQQNSDKCWEEFETRFQEIHRNFYQKLHNSFPGLTTNDVKLCALLKMGMNTKEICSVTFQSVRTVEAARLRLRKKLGLTNNENLGVFLQKT